MKILKVTTAFLAAVKSVWTRGNPFAALTALWPTNEEGKYVIQAEGIRLAFTNHGAAVTNLWVNDTRGEEIDIVLGLDDPTGYPQMQSNPWLNGVIGRYAGYMSGASYRVGDTVYNVTGNAHNGTALFNGGNEGWGRQSWDIAAHIDNSITFVLFDRMWNGFPGVFASCLTHTVTPYEWRIAFGVTPLRRHGPINLSQQAFFNLDGFRRNTTKTIEEHTLHLPSAGMRFAVDDLGLPTGDLLSNRQGQEHDFWSSARNIPPGYDQTVALSHKHEGSKEESPVAVLSSPHSGITMRLFTDRDALHVHTWEEDGTIQLKKGQGNDTVPLHGAISLDISEWPDGINHPEWRNRQTLWGMEGLYTSFATYRFSVDRQK